MSDAAVSPAVNEHEAALATPFVKCLLRLIRAQDFDGSWRGKADTELLAGFIITKEQRRAIPIIGDPDPDVLWRLDMFYTAVSLAIEERSGLITSPMKEMKPMGASGAWFPRPGGWSFCRDVHRFGFETFRKLAEAGTKLVDDATAAIGFPPWRGREETDFEEGFMSNLDEMGKKVRKLQLRAAVAKMKLRDLAEDLPVQWTELEEVAEKAYAVFAELDDAKRELAAMKNLR